jgi:CO/xanthine dehydrogenase Mo-binding subunit
VSAPALGRRALLRRSGWLALAFTLPGASAPAQDAKPRLPGSLAQNRDLDAWIRVGADGSVTLLTGKVELGQGVLTALAQLCADELDVEMSRLRIVSGDTELSPDEGVTAGSTSIQNGGTAVRLAAAEVRSILVGLAAERLGAPRERLTSATGRSPTLPPGGAPPTGSCSATGGSSARRQPPCRPSRPRSVASSAGRCRGSTSRPS